MKKKNIKKKDKKRKFVTQDTYQLMFGTDAPTYTNTGNKYFRENTNKGTINGKSIIK